VFPNPNEEKMTKFLFVLIAGLSLFIASDVMAGGIFDPDTWNDPGSLLPRTFPNYGGLAP
jgi:hypothetical protein